MRGIVGFAIGRISVVILIDSAHRAGGLRIRTIAGFVNHPSITRLNAQKGSLGGAVSYSEHS